MDKLGTMLSIKRNKWTQPLSGIYATIGYSLLVFNLILIHLYPEKSVSFAYANGIAALIMFGLIHGLFHTYTFALNAMEQDKLETVLKLLNFLEEIDGTFSDEYGLTREQGDDD